MTRPEKEPDGDDVSGKDKGPGKDDSSGGNRPSGGENPAGGNEVSGSSFRGPTGAQTGNSNTQINNYTAPSASSAGTGSVRIATIVTALLFVAGVAGLGVIKFVPASGGSSQAGHVGEPEASRTSKPPAGPTDKPTPEKRKEPPSDRPSEAPSDRQTVGPPHSAPLAPSSLPPEPGNLTPQEEERLCVDVEGNRDESDLRVQMWRCNHADGQRWRMEEDGTLHSFTRCMDVKNWHEEAGTPVILFKCTGKPNQEWKWDGRAGGPGKLRNPMSNRCLGYPPGQGGEDEPLAIYDCDSSDARVWTHHR